MHLLYVKISAIYVDYKVVYVGETLREAIFSNPLMTVPVTPHEQLLSATVMPHYHFFLPVRCYDECGPIRKSYQICLVV